MVLRCCHTVLHNQNITKARKKGNEKLTLCKMGNLYQGVVLLTETSEEKRLRTLESRVDKIETKVDGMSEDIKEIKGDQKKLLFAIGSALFTGIVTLCVAIVNLLRATG